MSSNANMLPRTLLPKFEPDSPRSVEGIRERGEPPVKKQRKVISNACMPCKKRKSKCDGERPDCSACITVYGTSCLYDLDADHRRKGALKRDIAELTESNRKVGLIIDAIRNRSEAEVDDLISLIRADSELSHDEIAEKIATFKVVKQPEVAEALPTSLEGELTVDLRRGSLDTSGDSTHYGTTSNLGLPDQRTISVDHIGVWTTVTNDDGLINHLLGLYFTWAHPWYLLFSEEVFYHGLEQRKLKYCTPLLVNAILALGCVYSERPEARAVPNNSRTVGDHFFSEAKRLLGQDENRSSLTIVQALGLMSLRQAMHNNDSAGRRYAAQMMSMAIELGLHTSVAPALNGKLTPTEIEARRVTFWGCFVLDIGWAVCAGRISFLPRSGMCIDKPILSADLERKPWPSTPESGSSISPTPNKLQQPSHRYGLLVQVSQLSEIMDDIIHMFYAPRDRITSRRLQLYHEKLEAWFEGLPEELAMKTSGPTLPQIITLHMYYYNCVLLLFRPYLNWTFVQQMSRSPRQICAESANAISELMTIYVARYGARRLFFINLHSIVSAAIIHLTNLIRPNSTPEQAHHLASSIKVINEASKTYSIANRFANVIRNKVYTWSKNSIPPSVKEALDDRRTPSPPSAKVSPVHLLVPGQAVSASPNRNSSVGSTSSTMSNPYSNQQRNSYARKPSVFEIMQMAPPSTMNTTTYATHVQTQNGFFNPLGGFEGIPMPVQNHVGNSGPMGITGLLDGEFPDWNKDGFILEQGGPIDFNWGFATGFNGRNLNGEHRGGM